MTNERVAVLDASQSIFDVPARDAAGPNQIDGALQPIPDFSAAVAEVVRESMKSGAIKPRQTALVDVGFVCDAAVVQPLALAIHKKVLILIKQ
jgi:hypothetical protein